MRRTQSYWRCDWWNVGRSCHASYCVLIFCVGPGFPEIQAGKRVWSTRWWRRQRIERWISWEAGNLGNYWCVMYIKYVPVFHHTFLIWNWLFALIRTPLLMRGLSIRLFWNRIGGGPCWPWITRTVSKIPQLFILSTSNCEWHSSAKSALESKKICQPMSGFSRYTRSTYGVRKTASATWMDVRT